jgi:hypothetical protein
MLPPHIVNEIIRRLPTADPDTLTEVADAVGIDVAAATDPLPSVNESAPGIVPTWGWEGGPVSGAVPFEMKLSVLGKEVTQSCRAVFSTCLVDDVDRATGEPIRIAGSLGISWQILDWRDLNRIDEATGEQARLAAPVWRDDFEGLLPAEVPNLILDLIEREACAIETAGRSNG